MACYTRSPEFKAIQLAASAAAQEKARAAAENRPPKIHKARPTRRMFACLHCGEQVRAHYRKHKFCSHEHYRAYMAERFDRWVASPHDIATLRGYDEFMMQEELPCIVDGCEWAGLHLSNHVNYAHGITAAEFKRAAGFNLGTGLVAPATREALRAREHIHHATGLLPGAGAGSVPSTYRSREGDEHRAKARALAAGRRLSTS